MTRDVIVVGGGVIGCSIAWRLAQAGLKVTVIERGAIGCEASSAAAGMLTPQGEASGPSPFLEMGLRSRAMYRSFAQELLDASGIDIEYNDAGTLFVLIDDEPSKLEWVKWQKEAGLSVENISREDLRNLEPAVTELASGAIFLPDEHQVENRRLMDALAIAIKRSGVELIEGRPVEEVVIERDRAIGISSRGEFLSATFVVIAAGTWSSHLLDPLGITIGVRPAKGQMLSVHPSAPSITRVLHSKNVYLVPRRDGRILIGATVEDRGFDKAVTVAGIRYLLDAALELVPSLAGSEIIETWAGLRPDTPNHLPWLGPTAIENLLLATGHFRNGILLAPITAELISRFLIDKETSLLNAFGFNHRTSN